MRVLYDLRYAADHFAGIGTHAHELLSAMLATGPEDRYRVLWRRADQATRFDLQALRAHPAVEWIETEAAPLGVAAPLATGALTRRYSADVYLSPFYLRPWRSPMPVVLTLHDAMHLAPEVRAPWKLRIQFGAALAWAAGADAVITSSRFSRAEILQRSRIRESQLHVVPPGSPETRTHDLVRPAGAPPRPFALVVGGNRPHKNLALLARVWHRFGEQAPLDLVAAGAVDERFASLHTPSASPRTHVLGAVTAPELEWLYANAHFLVMPTRHEGYGLPLVEAASRGLPVLCSDIPALREIGEGFASFLPIDGDAAWEDRIRRLASDPSERARLSAAGRARAAELRYANCAAGVRLVLRHVVERSR